MSLSQPKAISLKPQGHIAEGEENQELLAQVRETPPLGAEELFKLAKFYKQYPTNAALGNHLALLALANASNNPAFRQTALLEYVQFGDYVEDIGEGINPFNENPQEDKRDGAQFLRKAAPLDQPAPAAAPIKGSGPIGPTTGDFIEDISTGDFIEDISEGMSPFDPRDRREDQRDQAPSLHKAAPVDPPASDTAQPNASDPGPTIGDFIEDISEGINPFDPRDAQEDRADRPQNRASLAASKKEKGQPVSLSVRIIPVASFGLLVETLTVKDEGKDVNYSFIIGVAPSVR